MINPDTQENINIKIEQAQESAKNALRLCESYAHTQSPKVLKRLGGYLGTFVNNLRSALNYATVDYCDQRRFRSKNGKLLRTKDFPYSFVEADFKRIELVSLMSQVDPELYNFIEGIQPFHPNKSSVYKKGAIMAANSHGLLMTPMGNDKLDPQKNINWLGTIMKISNMDKHNILVKPQEMNINRFAVLDEGFFEPKHLGVVVLVGEANGKPIFVNTPCYVPQIGMFALKDYKWLDFMIPVDGGFLEFIPYMQGTTKRIVVTLNKFYSLWK